MIACIGIGIGIGIGNGIGNGIPQHRCVKAFDNGARPHNRETVSCRASVDSYRDYDCWLFSAMACDLIRQRGTETR